jgi:hypothetical protein
VTGTIQIERQDLPEEADLGASQLSEVVEERVVVVDDSAKLGGGSSLGETQAEV